jgi:hypothetical protein
MKNQIFAAAACLLLLFFIFIWKTPLPKFLSKDSAPSEIPRIAQAETTPLPCQELPGSVIVKAEAIQKTPKASCLKDSRVFLLHSVQMLNLTQFTTVLEAEKLFHTYIVQAEITCPDTVRVGNKGDGGYVVCVTPPYNIQAPCLVWSFGIFVDWSFDDHMANSYKCTGRAFDPSLKEPDHKRGNHIWFYKAGLSGTDIDKNAYGWKLRTLESFANETGDSNKVIDILKIDAEYAEWEGLEAEIKGSGVLSRTKQLAVEFHLQPVPNFPHPPNNCNVVTLEQYIRYAKLVIALRDRGFRIISNVLNVLCRFVSAHTKATYCCCYEMAFININFLV